MQLRAMDTTLHSAGGDAVVLDFNHYIKSY